MSPKWNWPFLNDFGLLGCVWRDFWILTRFLPAFEGIFAFRRIFGCLRFGLLPLEGNLPAFEGIFFPPLL